MIEPHCLTNDGDAARRLFPAVFLGHRIRFRGAAKMVSSEPILIWSGGAHGVGAATMHAEIDWAIQYDFYMSNGGCESAVVSIKVMP